MASPPLLNLASLGLSLDQARRARRSDEHGAGEGVQSMVQPPVRPASPRQDEADHDLDSTRGTDSDTSVEPARGELGAIANADEVGERPYPLCLLCLARPPSAVLLPCELVQDVDHCGASGEPTGCHLNLCHLCAPLLLHRASATTLTTASSDSTSNTSRPAQGYALRPHPLAPPHSRASWGDTAESLSPSSDTIDTPPSPMIALEDGWEVPNLGDAQTGETGETGSVDALRLDLGQGDDSALAVDRAGTGGTAGTFPDSNSVLGLGASTRLPTHGFVVSERHGAELQSLTHAQTQSQTQTQTPAQPHTLPPLPVPSDVHSVRTPWNTLLFRATAGNAKSRRLALGGYIAPGKSLRGGEMDGGDVLPRTPRTSRNQDAMRDRDLRDQAILLHLAGNVDEDEDKHAEEARREQEERLGFSSSWARARVQAVGKETNETDQSDATRRVVLSPRLAAGDKHGARCLVCRAGVEGWLRVYTG